MSESTPPVARNVIFLLPDGFGPAADTGYRWFKGEGAEDPVWSDYLRVQVHTESANNPVTDSAASATAYATGVKTFNGGVGVDAEGNPVTSVLDIASAAGKATGIVSTAAIWDASPAAFAASNANRSNAGAITQEYIDNGDLDVILGGGRAAFELDADGDNRTTLQEAQDAGFDLVQTGAELSGYGGDKLLGLFNDEDMVAPIGGGAPGERPNGEPSLAEMMEAALGVLGNDEDGFFLFVEEEGTDTWGHANDAGTVFNSAASFEKAWQVALDYVAAHPDTLIVSVADHETGGMTLELGNDRLPSIYQDFQATYEAMGTAVLAAVDALGEDADQAAVVGAVNAVVSDLTGGTVTLTGTEIGTILGAEDEDAAYAALAAVLNARGGIDFTTTGHTAVDVPLYATGAGAELFNGVIDNTAVAELVARAMGLSLTEEPDDGTIRGTPGDDDLTGTRDDDVVEAGAGNDRVAGRAGDDAVNGGAGDDRLDGGAGDDRLAGNVGADRMTGGAGDDHLRGDDGDDRIAGGADDDRLMGGEGDDRLTGNDGDDRLLADAGADRLDGGAGDDRLTGGEGDDRMTGGDGDDVFIFAAGSGSDRVTDFVGGEDRIVFEGGLFADFEALLEASESVGDDLIVSYGEGDQLRIDSYALSASSESDFRLV
ncbi:alkaline phosphatase [Pararoseomonas sp. SCSIO 73927]|uniref:alkaline phosphatase n=1 Tax=Pararoseomonas sp. SCSIO 73927 TaxID=3114537 RepID=UPI0030CEA01A